jgi:hypothetical protein
MLLVAALVAIPFGQVFHLRLGFITLNLFELIQLLLLLLLIIVVIYRGLRSTWGLLWGAWIGLSFTYAIWSAAIGDASVGDAVRHLRFYLPFYVASTILAVPLVGDAQTFSRWLTVSAGVSAAAALAIHHFFPTFLESAFEASEDVAVIAVELGRLYWANGLIVFLVVARFLIDRRGSLLDWVILVVAVGAVFNTVSRTVIATMLVFWTVSWILLSRRTARDFGAIVLVAVLVLSATVVALSLDDRLSEAVSRRFLGEGDIGAVYEEAIVVNRLVMYEQYLESLLVNFPVGQGLGKPFSTIPNEAFITDISLLSFLLPFGLLGGTLLITFIALAWATSRSSNRTDYGDRWAVAMRLILVVFVLMSLNLDVFSRNNAVIWYAVLLNLLGRRAAPSLPRHAN